jgi:hypothetical protein
LFQPATGHSEVAHQIDVGGGSGGLVTVALDQTPASDIPVMARAERTVTTELGGARRVAREAWTLDAETPSLAAR